MNEQRAGACPPPRSGDSMNYLISCMNSMADGIYSDFVSDDEAASYAANYEGCCHRLENDGSMTLIYDPWQEGSASLLDKTDT